ncbi:MAG: serine/threonine-protein kinase, partial [Isosphaeraceae bacterium]
MSRVVAERWNDGRSTVTGESLTTRATLLLAPHDDSCLEFEFRDDLDDSLDSASVRDILPEEEDFPWSTEPESDSTCLTSVDSHLGRYQVLGLLGEGQYARVYRGLDPVLQRTVALKVLRGGLLRQDKMKERFLNEGRALARLSHPRIVPVYDAGCHAGLYFIAMGLIEGESLADLRNRGLLQPGVSRALEIVADVAAALAYAHCHGIIHRDVKPLNIQLDPAGQVYLMDFGIAHHGGLADSWGDGQRRTGTPAYVAPEIARGNHGGIQPASDQYSLGVVFYELLCGRTPFVGPPLHV